MAQHLFRQLDHHIRDLHVFFGLVLGSHLEDDVLLVIRNWLLADMLHKLAHAKVMLVNKGGVEKTEGTYGKGRRSFTFEGG